MNAKRRRFVAEYLKDQNAKQAAIRAGYSKRSAQSDGPRLLTYADVRAAVEAGMQKLEAEAGVSATWIIKSLEEVANRCMQKVPVMVRDPADGRKMIQKTEYNAETGQEEGVWEFDSAGANRSLELLGKTKALFTENVKLGAMSLEKLLGESNE